MSDEILTVQLNDQQIFQLVKGGGLLAVIPSPGEGKRIVLLSDTAEALAKSSVRYKIVDVE